MDNDKLTDWRAQLATRYQQRFGEQLSASLLARYVQDEISRRKADFLRAELVNLDLSFAELCSLANSIAAGESGGLPLGPTLKKRRGRRPVLTDEQRAERRRTYARAYYQRRKQQLQLERQADGAAGDLESAEPEKAYKTSAQQRAYQRAYYRRRRDSKAPDVLSEPLIRDDDHLSPGPRTITRLRKSPPTDS